MNDDAFTLFEPPARTTSVVFASPHSGCRYPRDFLAASVLDEQTIRSSEDAYVDRLFAIAPKFGAPLLAAVAPRAFVDLNRASDELDPALIDGAARGQHNPRIASGLGVIPRVVAGGRPIYSGKISRTEADRRIGLWWRPYHDRLQQMLTENLRTLGEAILVDCHSMPHEAIDTMTRAGAPAADVVLGDRFGAAAGHDIVDRIEAAFSAAGLNVARNAPFAGAFTAQHYGRPARNQHAVQIELDRRLYMDEATITPRPDFEAFCDLLAGVISEITDVGRARQTRPLAAE